MFWHDEWYIARSGSTPYDYRDLPSKNPHSRNQISWSEISLQQSIHLKKKNNRSRDVVADCRDSHTFKWHRSVGFKHQRSQWSAFVVRKRLGAKETWGREIRLHELGNPSESLPRHKFLFSKSVWEQSSCVRRRKERADKPLKGAWAEIGCHHVITGGDRVTKLESTKISQLGCVASFESQ